jgi:hypothetical protein
LAWRTAHFPKSPLVLEGSDVTSLPFVTPRGAGQGSWEAIQSFRAGEDSTLAMRAYLVSVPA